MELFTGWAAVTKGTLVHLRGETKNHRIITEPRKLFLWDKQRYNFTVHSQLCKNTLHGLFQDTAVQHEDRTQQLPTKPEQQKLPCQPLCGGSRAPSPAPAVELAGSALGGL